MSWIIIDSHWLCVELHTFYASFWWTVTTQIYFLATTIICSLATLNYDYCSWGVEPETTWNKSGWWSAQDLNSRSPDFKSAAPITSPHCHTTSLSIMEALCIVASQLHNRQIPWQFQVRRKSSWQTCPLHQHHPTCLRPCWCPTLEHHFQPGVLQQLMPPVKHDKNNHFSYPSHSTPLGIL